MLFDGFFGQALEDIDTLSDIVDNEMGVNDLSDEEKEPRLKLPNLNPQKKEKKKVSNVTVLTVKGLVIFRTTTI